MAFRSPRGKILQIIWKSTTWIITNINSLYHQTISNKVAGVPVHYRKDRVTVVEREVEELKLQELEVEAKKQVEERRRYTLKIVEEEAKKEFEETRRTLAALDALDTDGENEEEEYESWKVRELKRIKRDREAREA